MTEQSLWGYISHASLIVKWVMVLLFLASVSSWALILQRGHLLRKARIALLEFENAFWSGTDLSRFYQEVKTAQQDPDGLAAIFVAGFAEFLRLKDHKAMTRGALTENIQRAMRVAHNRVCDHLEEYLPFLATVGSVSPYVGLLGTVWGIMVSFQSLSQTGQATIAMVAPGISEALVATAMGLFAAIPAVIAYNRYNYALERLSNRFEAFQQEFINILSHQVSFSDENRV